MYMSQYLIDAVVTVNDTLYYYQISRHLTMVTYCIAAFIDAVVLNC